MRNQEFRGELIILHFFRISSNTILMKKVSKVLFVIWLFILSMLPCGIVYNKQSIDSDINMTAIENVCNAIGQNYKRKDSSIRIATYNLLADGIGFYGSRSDLRAEGMVNFLCKVDADVIGLQEVSRWWFCNIKSKTRYAFVDPLRTEIGGLMTAIAYNPRRVDLLDYGNIPLEKGSNSRLRRIVWGIFRHKSTGERYCVVNTHFNVMLSDSSSGLVQAQQLTDFVRKISEDYNCPVVVTGDFNAKKRGAVSYCTSVVYDVLSLKMTDVRYPAVNKGCGRGKGLFAYCVDHIFAVGELRVSECTLLSQSELHKLSDHYLMFTDIAI